MRTSTHEDVGKGTPRQLGSHYTLEHVLGRGATGEVWRAHDDHGTTVAVKLLRPELADDPEVVARFLRERHVVRSVHDDHVVGVHDLVIEGETLAVVMDRVMGPDLRTYLRERGRLAPVAAVAIVRQVLQGLAAVHHAGVVHRDVKPANVLVDERTPGIPVAKLTDFGLSRLLDGSSVTRTTGVVGTPRYMAPELGDGRDPTPASDLYAVGVMLYELLAGHLPFEAANPVAMLRAHAEDEVSRPPDLPDSVWDVLTTLLAKDPGDRYPDAETALVALDAVKDDVASMRALPDDTPDDDPDDPSPTAATPGAAVTDAPERDRVEPGREARSGGADPSVSRRALVALLTAAALLVAGVGSFVATRGGHDVESLGWQDSYRGFVVKRYWWLSGRHGTTFHALEQIQPDTSLAAGSRYLLVVPKQLAARDVDVAFTGARPRVEQQDPAFSVDLGGISSAGELDVRYAIRVPPGGDAKSRLRRWNTNLHDERLRLRRAVPRLAVEIPHTSTIAPRRVAALLPSTDSAATASTHNRVRTSGAGGASDTPTGSGPSALATLDVSPRVVAIRQYQSTSLVLRGTTNDGSPALASVLSATSCTLDAPSVATCHALAGSDPSTAQVAVSGAAPGHARATLTNGGVSTTFDVDVSPVTGPALATLVRLHFSTPTATLGPPGSGVATVTLTGDMSDGSPAPGNVLGGVAVRPDDPGTVAVSVVGAGPGDASLTVALEPLAPGATTVTAASGSVRATLPVTVPKPPTSESVVAISGATLNAGAPVDATAGFGHAWTSITSVCWNLTFGTDPLDPTDGALTVGGFGAVTAPGPDPLTSAQVCAPAGADLSGFLGGSVGASLALDAGSVDLASVSVTVAGVPA
ncbi:MAG TPA: protein kinase [Acidimicrobiia bacterium]